MPSNKSPSFVNPGPGKLSAGQVPSSSLSFPVGGGDLDAHLNDPVDAHMSWAIGIPEVNPTTGQALLASAGGPYDGESVMDALTSLSDLLPVKPDKVGYDSGAIPNSGITNWTPAMTVGGSAIHGGFKSGSAAIVTKYLTPVGSIGTQTIGGMVFPADRGVLAVYHTTNSNFFNPAETTLVSALWLGSSVLAPAGIASANFIEATRSSGQTNYTPTGTGLDSITLIDRLPYLSSYPGGQYTAFGSNFYAYQLGKYRFPVSIVAGNSGSYLLVHWKETYATTLASIQPANLTVGNLVTAKCYSAVPSDATAYNNVLRANVFADTLSGSGPTGGSITTSPAGTATTMNLSGIAYYNSTAFQVNVLSTAANVFSNSFLTNISASSSVPVGYESALPVVQAIMDQFNGTLWSYPLFDGSNVVDNVGSLAFSLSNPPDPTSVARFSNATQTAFTVVSPIPKPVYPNAQVVVRWRGAFSSAADLTSSERYLVNPAYNESTLTTDVKESFVSESYRYISSYSAPSDSVPIHPAGGDVFDSTGTIASGALQVYSGRVVYPTTNFSASQFKPTQTSRDYSAIYSADGANTKRRYIRAFNTGIARNTGKILLTGLSAASFNAANTPDPNEITDHTGGAIVQIKVPGATGWLDLGRSDGTPDNNKTLDFRGCKVGVLESGGVTTVTYSTGGTMTAPNSEGKYLLFVRVTLIKNGTGENLTLQGIDWATPT
jgi:hypothetical protein